MLLRRDRREEIAEVWLRATGFSPIVAMAGASKDERILPFYGDAGGVTQLVTRRIEEDGLALVIERWFANVQQAQRVYSLAFGIIPAVQGWIEVSPSDGNRMVLERAKEVDIKVNSAAEMVVMAIGAADEIIATSERQRLSGELHEVNQAYKSYRKALLLHKSPVKPMDYQDWLHAYRLRVATAAGIKLRHSFQLFT